MARPAAIHVHASLSTASAPIRFARCLRIGFRSGAWHLSEDVTGRIGGIFTSLSAAVSFARSELRGMPGCGVVIVQDRALEDGARDRPASPIVIDR
jgi:hypothetical protein